MTTTALLIMDVQHGVVNRYPDAAEPVLERLAGAASAARAGGVRVVYVRVAFRDGAPEVSPRNRMFAALASAVGRFGDDDASTQIHPVVAPQPGDVVVTKRRVSAFTGSDLDVVLRSLGIERLVLTGIATSGVVLSTLRQAADLDYELVVLGDGCLDGDEEVHRVLCEKVFPRQAEVVDVETWVESLPRPTSR
jgi:nicotinamidase-related amidase